jgi:hypothetical protein
MTRVQETPGKEAWAELMLKIHLSCGLTSHTPM